MLSASVHTHSLSQLSVDVQTSTSSNLSGTSVSPIE